MIKSIVIAVVVSIIVWALSFDLFFGYNGTVLSFGIALAAGVIAALIVRVITPKIGLHVLIVAIVAVAAVFVASKLVTTITCPAVPEAKVQCGPPEIIPECLTAAKGTTFLWNTQGLADGVKVKIHKFKKKYGPFPGPAQPLNKKEYDLDKNSHDSATVGNKDGIFKYSITCSQNGKDDSKDPMIDVPK